MLNYYGRFYTVILLIIFNTDFIKFRPSKEKESLLFSERQQLEEELLLYSKCQIIHRTFRSLLKYQVSIMRSKGKHVWLDMASMKLPSSYRRKILFDHDFNHQTHLIDDIVRATVVFKSKKDLYRFATRIKRYYIVSSKKDYIKNNKKRIKAYYLKLIDPFSENFKGSKIIIELQLQLCNTYLLQKDTHDLYKVMRNIESIEYLSNEGDFPVNLYEVENSFHPYHIILKLQRKFIEKSSNLKRVARINLLIEENKYYIRKFIKRYVNDNEFKNELNEYFESLYFKFMEYKFNSYSTHKEFYNFLNQLVGKFVHEAFEKKNKECNICKLDQIHLYS